jgi:hypothetical protein
MDTPAVESPTTIRHMDLVFESLVNLGRRLFEKRQLGLGDFEQFVITHGRQFFPCKHACLRTNPGLYHDVWWMWFNLAKVVRVDLVKEGNEREDLPLRPDTYGFQYCSPSRHQFTLLLVLSYTMQRPGVPCVSGGLDETARKIYAQISSTLSAKCPSIAFN